MGGSSRQDSIRSGYASDHEALSSQAHAHPMAAGSAQHGAHAQHAGARRQSSTASLQMARQNSRGQSMDGQTGQQQDPRLCYLTSSEVSSHCHFILILYRNMVAEWNVRNLCN